MAYDRGQKPWVHARAGVPDSWILDLVGGTLEVYRKPKADHDAERPMVSADASVAAQGRPDQTLLVKDLLS